MGDQYVQLVEGLPPPYTCSRYLRSLNLDLLFIVILQGKFVAADCCRRMNEQVARYPSCKTPEEAYRTTFSQSRVFKEKSERT